MTNEEVAVILAEKLRTDLDLRRSLGMDEGDESGKVDGEDAVGFTDGHGVQHFITVETA
jgi:hypothetical protein